MSTTTRAFSFFFGYLVSHAFFSLLSTLHADVPELTRVVRNRAQLFSYKYCVPSVYMSRHWAPWREDLASANFRLFHSSGREEMQIDVCNLKQNVALMLF